MRDPLGSTPANASPPASSTNKAFDAAARIHKITVSFLQLIMGAELALLFLEGQWGAVCLVSLVMIITMAPVVLGKWFPVTILPEIQVLAIIFVFASVFLGEVRMFYEKIWWWDIALHFNSGVLLGILGFLLVYILNADERVDVHLNPGFVAFFAFLFAVATGALWEIFEFAMDQLFGTNMQKPMPGDSSGLIDTMWDLIVDALGALGVTLLGWWYMKRRKRSFIETMVQRFIESNPRLFPTR